MREPLSFSFERILPRILFLFAAWSIASYVFVALSRMNFPFEIRMVEGSSLLVVKHLLLGQKLYVAPSIDFVSPIYPPLYFYAAAFMSRFMGEGFFPLRLLSFFASIASFLLIYQWVTKETKSRFVGFIACSLFAATFSISEFTFDLARPDTLYLFFLLLACYLLRFQISISGYTMAAFFLCLSYLTKQPALFMAVFMWLYAFLAERRLSYVFGLTFLIFAGGAFFILNAYYDGWFYFYNFEILASHSLDKSQIYNFWSKYIFGNLAVASSLAVSYFLFNFKQSTKISLFYSFLISGALTASWISLAHVGGSHNVLLPSNAVLAILFGLGVKSLFQEAESIADKVIRRFTIFFIYGLCMVQFLALWYYPPSCIPQARDRIVVEEWVQKIKNIKGDVFFPLHNYLSVLAGKKGYAYGFWVWDVIRSKNELAKGRLLEEFRRAFSEKRFSAVFLESEEIGWKKTEKPSSRYWWEKADIASYYTAAKPFRRYPSPIFRRYQVDHYLYLPKDNFDEPT